MTRFRDLLVALAGAVLAAVGGAILWANPPLPPAFGGSFHGNVQELSILADRLGALALVGGAVLLVFAAARAVLGRRRQDPTGAPTSPGPTRRHRPSG